ncbi:MAG: sugar phosphate isomerase/epimerase [Acidobacteriota bacterium]
MLHRRRFIRESAAALTAAGLLKPSPTPPRSFSMPSLGLRLGGPVFVKTEDPEELAEAHLQQGYRAAYCPKAELNDKERIRSIASAFSKRGVVIAEVGRWVNLLDSDPARRAQNLKIVSDGLALAEDVGALGCVDIAGSFNPTVWYGPHPENLSQNFFDAAVENARKIIDAVKPRRAKFSYEMMGWSLPDSPDSCLEMLKAVDRAAFAVHLDPCNLVNSPRRFYRNADLVNECFDRLGPWIVSCHAKDLTWDVEMNIHFREVRPGAGSMDYRIYLRRLASLPHRPPLMLEHLPNSEEYDQARHYLFDLGKEIGLSFG